MASSSHARRLPEEASPASSLVPMSGAAEEAAESEAFRQLSSMAHKRTGAIPAPLLVRRVLEATRQGHWPLRRGAMEALLRRLDFLRSNRLAVASRPAAGALFGLYTTRRKGSSERPYTTLLEGIDPPRGSCDCPDFLRNSLGLCKHLLAVLDDLHGTPRKLKARIEAASDSPAAGPRLRWDPIRPLRGPGDWLEQVRWFSGAEAAERGAAAQAARRWFDSARGGERLLNNAYLTNPARRAELVRDLLTFLKLQGLERRKGASPQDPALRALLETESARLERAIAGAGAARNLRAGLRDLKLKLYPYQEEGVERFLACGRLLLADDMGLGKTAQAIAACQALFAGGKVRRGLLIVPAALKPQWLREWQLFSDVPVEVVDGGAEARAAAYRRAARGFLITNYEQVIRDLAAIHRWQPDVVVLDEAQRIKNWATKTAAYVKQLQPPYRLVLTGTPMENRLEELASILDWVDDRALEPKWRLVPWHTILVDGAQEVGGAANLDTLRARLRGCVLRRVRQEVLSQLPSRTDTVVPVPMTPAQQEEHAALDGPIRTLVKIAQKRPLTQAEFIKLMLLFATQRIISNGIGQFRFEEIWPALARMERPTETMLQSLSSPKLLELRELLTQLVAGQERKVVVFSQWRRMLRLADWAVRDILSDCGARAVYFTGQEGQRRRTQNIVDFHDDRRTRVLFASDAGGVGLNLQRAASACINLELPWNPAVLEQRIGRIYRLGQKRPIDVYNLVCSEGIEARIAKLVGDKRAFFSGLFDGQSDEVRFERSGSFMARLERLIEPVKVPELPAADGAAEEGDGATEREVEAAIAAADESCDAPAPAAATAAAPAAPAAGAPGLPPPEELRSLFTQLAVRPTAAGGISIEAPPEAAASLAALFEGMARMLQGASRS